jgi:hypothetical protein
MHPLVHFTLGRVIKRNDRCSIQGYCRISYRFNPDRHKPPSLRRFLLNTVKLWGRDTCFMYIAKLSCQLHFSLYDFPLCLA